MLWRQFVDILLLYLPIIELQCKKKVGACRCWMILRKNLNFSSTLDPRSQNEMIKKNSIIKKCEGEESRKSVNSKDLLSLAHLSSISGNWKLISLLLHEMYTFTCQNFYCAILHKIRFFFLPYVEQVQVFQGQLSDKLSVSREANLLACDCFICLSKPRRNTK